MIKPSARRINQVASEWVGRRGSTRRFATKSDAVAWASAVSRRGEQVRVQDAAPNDTEPYDGYLVADPSRNRSRKLADESVQGELGTGEKEWSV